MYADVNGARIFYRDEGDGHPIVLIHGRVGTHSTWASVWEALGREYRTIAFDQQGQGSSSLGPAEYSIASMADDVIGLLDHLDIGLATLIGISMGGSIVQTCALSSPDRVHSLVLVSTSSEFSPATRARFIEEARIVPREGMEAIVGPQVDRWFTRDFFESSPDVVSAWRERVLGTNPAVFAMRSRANASRDLTARLPEIRCPVLVIGGTEDPMGSIAHAERFKANLPDCRVRLIPNASHILVEEAPAEFVDAVRSFLGRTVS